MNLRLLTANYAVNISYIFSLNKSGICVQTEVKLNYTAWFDCREEEICSQLSSVH